MMNLLRTYVFRQKNTPSCSKIIVTDQIYSSPSPKAMAPTSRTQVSKGKKATAPKKTGAISKPPSGSASTVTKKPKRSLKSSTSNSSLATITKRSDISRIKVHQDELFLSIEKAPLESLGLLNAEAGKRERQMAAKTAKQVEKDRAQEETRNFNMRLLEQLENLGGLSV